MCNTGAGRGSSPGAETEPTRQMTKHEGEGAPTRMRMGVGAYMSWDVWGDFRGCASWGVMLCVCKNSDGWLAGSMGSVSVHAGLFLLSVDSSFQS